MIGLFLGDLPSKSRLGNFLAAVLEIKSGGCLTEPPVLQLVLIFFCLHVALKHWMFLVASFVLDQNDKEEKLRILYRLVERHAPNNVRAIDHMVRVKEAEERRKERTEEIMKKIKKERESKKAKAAA